MELTHDFFAQFAQEQENNLEFLQRSDTVTIIKTEKPVFLSMEEVLTAYQALGFAKDNPVKTGLLESAINRPQNVHYYNGEESVGRLAAELCFGLIQNHAFLDGNKRTAFVATCAFLYKNDCVLDDYAGLAEIVLDVARHTVSFEELSHWLEYNISVKEENSPALC